MSGKHHHEHPHSHSYIHERKIYPLDAISGIISSVIITKWAVELMRDSGRELIDFKRTG